LLLSRPALDPGLSGPLGACHRGRASDQTGASDRIVVAIASAGQLTDVRHHEVGEPAQDQAVSGVAAFGKVGEPAHLDRFADPEPIPKLDPRVGARDRDEGGWHDRCSLGNS